MIAHGSKGLWAPAAALGALFCAGPALGQDDPVAKGSADAAAPLGDHARPAKWRAEVTAGTENKTASVSVDLLRLLAKPASQPNSTRVLDHALELTVTTPWDKENDAFLADLDGLADGTSIGLTYSLLGSSRRAVSSTEQQALHGRAVELCNDDWAAKLGVKPLAPTATPDDVVKKREEVAKKCGTLLPDGTDAATLIAKYLSAREQRAYASGFFKDTFSVAFSGKVEFQDFKFVDPTSLAKMKDDKTSWSAGLNLTKYFRASPTAVTFGGAYERAWKSADKKILCPVPSGPTPVECVDSPDAPPTLEDGFKLSANLRTRFFAGDELSNFAISPKVTYDVTNDVFGAELPIYLVPDKDGGLVGGVKVGYRSDTDDVVFGIFVGTAFGIVQ